MTEDKSTSSALTSIFFAKGKLVATYIFFKKNKHYKIVIVKSMGSTVRMT